MCWGVGWECVGQCVEVLQCDVVGRTHSIVLRALNGVGSV